MICLIYMSAGVWLEMHGESGMELMDFNAFTMGEPRHGPCPNHQNLLTNDYHQILETTGLDKLPFYCFREHMFGSYLP